MSQIPYDPMQRCPVNGQLPDILVEAVDQIHLMEEILNIQGGDAE